MKKLRFAGVLLVMFAASLTMSCHTFDMNTFSNLVADLTGGAIGGGTFEWDGHYDGVPKTVTITGIDPSLRGNVLVSLSENGRQLSRTLVALGQANVQNNSLRIALLDARDEEKTFTGIGGLYLVLIFEAHDDLVYFYSEGGATARRYVISDASQTVSFDQFTKLEK